MLTSKVVCRYCVVFADNDNRTAEQVSNALLPLFNNEIPIVKTLENSNTMKVTTSYLIESTYSDADTKVEDLLMKGLNITKDQIQSSQKVGPTVADDIQNFSLLCNFVFHRCHLPYRRPLP